MGNQAGVTGTKKEDEISTETETRADAAGAAAAAEEAQKEALFAEMSELHDKRTAEPTDKGEDTTPPAEEPEHKAEVRKPAPSKTGAEPTGLSERVLADAEKFGLSKEDAAEMFTDDRSARRWMITAATATPVAPTPAPAPDVARPTVTEAKPDAAEESASGEFKLDWGEEAEEIPAAMRTNIEKAFGNVQSKLAAMESRFEQVAPLVRQAQVQANQAAVALSDSYFEPLGEEYHDLFGKGKFDQVDPKLQEERTRVMWEAVDINKSMMARGCAPLEAKEAFEQAVWALHHKKALSIVRKGVNQKLEQRRSSGTPRPTHHTAVEPNDVQKLTEEIAREIEEEAARRGIG